MEERVTPAIEVGLTDGRVAVDGEAVHLTCREFDLLAALALERAPLATETLIDRIWPDKDNDEGRASLKVYVHRLRRAIGHGSIILGDRRQWRLSCGVSVDTWHWETALNECKASPLDDQTRTTLFAAYAALLMPRSAYVMRSALYTDLDEAFQGLLRSIGVRLVEDAIARGDASAALRIARSIMPIDPYSEVVHEAILRAHVQMKNVRAVHAQIESYRSVGTARSAKVIGALQAALPS